MPLSSNQPDPVFPPVPPQERGPANAQPAPQTFGDFSGTPLENQPVTLENKAHVTTIVPEGSDPVIEEPVKGDSPPGDTTLSESAKGADYS